MAKKGRPFLSEEDKKQVKIIQVRVDMDFYHKVCLQIGAGFTVSDYVRDAIDEKMSRNGIGEGVLY